MLAGIRNMCVPKKVKTSITSVLISLTEPDKILKAWRSKSLLLSLKTISATPIKITSAPPNIASKIISSTDSKVNAADISFILTLTFLSIEK